MGAAQAATRLKPRFTSGPQSLVKGRATRFVMLNDVHVPHNIPLAGIWAFCKDFKPDYAIDAGDVLNMDPFSHWEKSNARKAKAMPQPLAYYRQAEELYYKPRRKAVGNGCVVIGIKGNHEEWADRAVDAMPEGEGYWEIENNIHDVDAWVRTGEMISLGKLWILHGEEVATGRHHAERVLHLLRRSSRYGHRHDIQQASFTSPIDITDRHTSRSCGTLEKFNPGFMKNRPHNWVHAFTYGVVQPNGHFWDRTVEIIDGKFWAEGRMY